MLDPSTGGSMTERSVIPLEDGHHRMEIRFHAGHGEPRPMEIRSSRA